MKNWPRWILAFVVTTVVTLLVGYASRAPLSLDGADQAHLRLSWRLRGAREETCRPRTQAELDALPVHMRTPQICTGRNIPYRLIVSIDGVPDTLLFVPAGAKGDRAIFVLHEKTVEPATHRVVIDFTPAIADSKRAPLHFQQDLQMRPGEITLVTLNREASQLVLSR